MSDEISPGHIADNIAFFARALRAAGIPVGPRTVLDAVEAVQAGGIGGREDLYWVLHAVFVTKRDRRSCSTRLSPLLAPAQPDREDDPDDDAFSPLQKESNEPKPLARVAEAMYGNQRQQQPAEKRASSSTRAWRCLTLRSSAPRISSG